MPIWLVIVLIVVILAAAACAIVWLLNQAHGDYDFGTPFGCLGVVLLALIGILLVLTVKGIFGWN